MLRITALFLLTIVSVGVAPSNGVINHKNKGRFYRGIDGGMECATCTVLISLLEQTAEVNNQTIVQSLDSFCLKLPDQFSKACQLMSEVFGPLLIELFVEDANPDDVCRGLGLCYKQKGEKLCSLYKDTVKFDEKRILHYQHKTRKHLYHWGLQSPNTSYNICDIPVINELCVLYDDIFKKHTPVQDADGDAHSTAETLRGASWRGKDCDDTRNDIYPGRRPEFLNDVDFDSNCNGILGFDNKTGKSYEEQYCKGTGQMGVVVLGDSVGAHFHVPEEWFDPSRLTKKSLSVLPFALENELDWPQLSLVTGYMDSIWKVTEGPTDSIYRRLVQRNRCNHRNYQNIASNGCNSFDLAENVEGLKINQTYDFPLLIILSLVGNDVCNHKPADETISNMTTEAEMRKNLIKLFTTLNSTVPAGSNVLIVGMADGDFLYQFLANRTHPFGKWRNDIKYRDVYEWWNCMEVTPCMGWLNNNATLRALTTKRAEKLSAVMSNVAKEFKHHWSNLELNYIDCPITTVIQEYVFKHGPGSGYQLIEPVDGFHPNQLGQALSAAEVWRHLSLKLPHYLGEPNPNNDAINRTFGDQGGY